MFQRISLVIFLLLGLSMTVLGIIYLTASEFMPYHSEAIQTAWHDLGPNSQGLFLGFLKGIGGGALIAGLATVTMTLFSFRGSVVPYLFVLPGVCLGYFGLLGYATYTVRRLTPGTPPLYLIVLAVGLATIASIALWIGSRDTQQYP